jgi:cell division protein FtsB
MGRLTSLLIVGMGILILGITVVGNRGMLHLAQIDREIHALESENQRLSSNISDIKNRIYAVQHDPLTIERQAREELGLSRKNEIIYVFPESSPAAQN